MPDHDGLLWTGEYTPIKQSITFIRISKRLMVYSLAHVQILHMRILNIT